MKNFLKIVMSFLLFAGGGSLHATTSDEFYSLVEQCRKNSEQWPAIAYAVKLGRADLVRFLIDMKEPVDAETAITEVWGSTFSDHLYRIEDQPGYTALELAIRANDSEIVEILLTHNPNNKADPERVRVRWNEEDLYYSTWALRMMSKQQKPTLVTTPLSYALKNKNLAIIQSLLKAYTDPERLFALYAEMKDERAMMRSWLEQNCFLWLQERLEISDQEVDLFMNETLTDAIKEKEINKIETFLQYGWMVNQFDFCFSFSDSSITELFLIQGRFTSGWNPYHELLENDLEELAMSYPSFELCCACVRHNRTDLLMQVMDRMVTKEEIHACFFSAVEYSSLDAISFLLAEKGFVEGALIHAVTLNNKAVVERLVQEATISDEEKEKALMIAYHTSAYDLISLIQQKL